MSQELQQPEAGSELAPTSQRFHGVPQGSRTPLSAGGWKLVSFSNPSPLLVCVE